MDGGLSEGRRERKRRETRERIEAAARTLFLQRGFDAATIEDITEAADVSKRSFFDYFPSKEDVVFAWQDAFADGIAAAVATRPLDEPVIRVVEESLASAILASADPQSMALFDLIRSTPALRARDHLKYSKLEQKLGEALAARAGSDEGERFRMRLLAAVVVAAMRTGGDRWHGMDSKLPLDAFAREVFTELWRLLASFGAEGSAGASTG